MFKKKQPDLGAIDWTRDRAVLAAQQRVEVLGAQEQTTRAAAEAAGAVALSVTEIEDLRTLVDAGREDRDRLETARSARAKAVIARDDHQRAAAALDAANVELASATHAARERALDAIRTCAVAGLDELAERLTLVAETNVKLQEIARAAEAAFTRDELRNLISVGMGLSELAPWPELVLGSADGTNPSDLQAWLDRRPRAVVSA